MTSNFLSKFMDRGKYDRSKTASGNYTNDIFDLEERQRETNVVVYQDKNTENETNHDKSLKKYHETEDVITNREISGRKLRRSLSDCKIKSDEPALKTPPLATGKENVGTHFKNTPLSSWTKIAEDPALLKSDESEDEELCKPASPQHRNPITGEGMEVNSELRNKLEDTTNIVNKDTEEEKFKPRVRRPCIRVREPPGGKSSIVF